MTHFIEILNISSQLPLHKWDCLNAYFSDFEFLHAHSVVWKAQNVQRIPLIEWLPGLCFWAAFRHGLFHCFMLHRGWLALNIASSPVFWALTSFRITTHEIQIFLYSCSIIHITLYTLEQLLYSHILWIFSPSFRLLFFFLIQLLRYERSLSEFVYQSHLPYNVQCAIVFQWKWTFGGVYFVYLCFEISDIYFVYLYFEISDIYFVYFEISAI